jgi:hypothetical protein
MAVVWFLGDAGAFGRDGMEVESRYDGDGWFHYRLRTLEDPFLASIDLRQLLPDPFPGYLTNTLPNHWTNSYYGDKWSGLMFDWTAPQPRINEISFSVRSTSRHFRRQANRFHTILYLEFTDPYFFPGGGIGGYVNLDCLLPCAPEQADGSPPALISRHEFIPDIKIDELIRTNQDIYGLTFSWAEPSTVELQGSHNLVDWTTVSRFFGNPPRTTWTTNVSLNRFGQFFRLSLIANSHLTKNRAAAAIISESDYSPEVPIEGLKFIDSQIRIGFVSAPNATYLLDERAWSGPTIATRQIEATKAFTTLSFDIRELRGAAFFKLRISDSKMGDVPLNGGPGLAVRRE